jgi:hypothetical protein
MNELREKVRGQLGEIADVAAPDYALRARR